MRTLIDLPDPTIAALANLSASTGQSRAALVRQAIEEFLEGRIRRAPDEAFGLWASGEDGLAVQMRLRNEW